MSIQLALTDATNNCQRQRAIAEVTLRSGKMYVGRLAGMKGVGTTHMETADGWATFLTDEIVGVEVRS